MNLNTLGVKLSERNRLWVALGAMTFLCILLGIALIVVSNRPIQIVKVLETAPGELVYAGSSENKPFDISSRNIEATLSKWVEDLVTTKDNEQVRQAAARVQFMVENEAVAQLKTETTNNNRFSWLRDNPGARIGFQYGGFTEPREKNAVISFEKLRVVANSTRSEQWFCSIQYEIKPLGKAFVRENPSGIFIQNFNCKEKSK